MPVHYAVAGVTPEQDPKSSTGHKFHPRDWVQIKGGYNDGDLALVAEPDPWMDYESSMIPIVLPPRLARTSADALRYAAISGSRPPPAPLFFEEATALGVEMNFKVVMLNCYWSKCSEKYPCGHLRGFLYDDMLFHRGLLALQEKLRALVAPPSSVDPKIFETFACSQHPAVRGSWLNMPIPSTWSFCKGDEVRVFEPFGPEYTGHLLPESCHCTVGIIQTVLPMSCKVAFGPKVFSLPIVLLQKQFGNTDIVYIPSIEGLGLVMAVDPSSCSVSVLLNDATMRRLEQQAIEENLTCSQNNKTFSTIVIEPVQSFTLNSVYKALSSTEIGDLSSSLTAMIQLLPSQNSLSQEYHTRQAPWIGTEVIVTKHLIRKGYQGVVIDVQWDDTCRHANILYDKVVKADAKEYENQVRGLLLLDPPLPEKWILSPMWHLSLHDLEFYIQVHHGPYASKDNQLVHLALSDGRLQVQMSTKRNDKRRSKYVKITAEDIRNIPPNGVRTKKVSRRAADARGLFLIADASNVKLYHHIGKLIRRVRNITHDDSGNLLAEEGLYFIQRVNLYPIPGRVGYEEEVMVDKVPFAIEWSSLLLVHLSANLNLAGNKKMYKIRTKFGGWMLACDEPDSEQKSQIAKQRKGEIVASVSGLAE
ncbi:hypothetical protein GYMLUDRAFT_249306 [Collybiopsis luxurians FD-317 M1]|uniref:Uncharacterized protein n=1 Tax=Collybiopsis luxurians FD-317 M1 TaxID=944289 RepID=A0A0D0BII2_9AGAR|nr:hypothetical protein GYMLUDRAFT_249306 [Collybiopsis luxurians FD-317 M1]